MSRKGRRLLLIGGCGIVLAGALALVLTAMSSSIVFFRAPSEIVAHPPAPGTRLRLGGLVAEGSVVRNGRDVAFDVTDGLHKVHVTYEGLLPDLFREGQGVVTEGTMTPGGSFHADTVLAKHDERYMPKNVVDALKAKGEWRPETATQ
ncbi:MAG TPA: cytochrome c maturation protein CcmE [Hyphomicrobiales bacterium]|nr:cytochrome c maturation protein CcmE [Hyphomicrobiales bacterium]